MTELRAAVADNITYEFPTQPKPACASFPFLSTVSLSLHRFIYFNYKLRIMLITSASFIAGLKQKRKKNDSIKLINDFVHVHSELACIFHAAQIASAEDSMNGWHREVIVRSGAAV